MREILQPKKTGKNLFRLGDAKMQNKELKMSPVF
jgi:hypothetical protein